ncbi:MAG: winged helix-turn-helix domain-containing protein [Acidimicrobiales bacterium]
MALSPKRWWPRSRSWTHPRPTPRSAAGWSSAGARFSLTGRERAVIAALARRPGAVISKDSLLQEAWEPDRAGLHTVEVTVGRLRQKVQPAGIVVGTARRRGYWLELEGASASMSAASPPRATMSAASPPRA